MAKQNQPQDGQQQKQKETNPTQQGGRNAQGQPGNKPGSQGQPGARQSDQGSQRGKTSNQFGTSADESDNSPTMQGEDNSSEKLRRGALDAQYGTDSSKADPQANRPQGSASDTTTGSDRDTMGGSRSKGK